MRLFDARSRALVQAGMVQPIDLVFISLDILIPVVLFFDWIFSPRCSWKDAACALLLLSVLQSFWALLLGYRACKLILEVRADVNLMPEAAARLARAGYAGASPEPRPP